MLPRRLSVTACKTLLRCPRQFLLQYVQHVRGDVPVDPAGDTARALGSAVHALLRAAFERILAGLPAPDGDTLFALTGTHFPPDVFPDAATRRAAMQQAVRLAMAEVAAYDPPARTCLHVERTHFFAAPEAVFTGRVDRLDGLSAAAGGGLEIVEYKTGRTPEPHGAQSALLHLLVAATFRQRTDLRPIRVTLVHLPSGKRDIVILHREEVKQVRLQILLALRRVDACDAPPDPGPHCRFCPFASPRWCPAYAAPEPWSTLDGIL